MIDVISKIFEAYNNENWDNSESDDFMPSIYQNVNDIITDIRLFYLPNDSDQFSHFLYEVGSIVCKGIDECFNSQRYITIPRIKLSDSRRDGYTPSRFIDEFNRSLLEYPIMKETHLISNPDILDFPNDKRNEHISKVTEYGQSISYSYSLSQTSKFINSLEKERVFFKEVPFLFYNANKRIFNTYSNLWTQLIIDIKHSLHESDYRYEGSCKNEEGPDIELYYISKKDPKRLLCFRFTNKNGGKGSSQEFPTGRMSIIFYYIKN